MRVLPLMVLVLILTVSATAARTWYITPDGTGDAPTIQAGIDSTALGDTVVVAPGVYRDYETRQPYGHPVSACVFMKHGIVLMSELGAGATTIDGEDEASHGVLCYGVYATTVVAGFTITGATHEQVFCFQSGEPVVRENEILGGIRCQEASPMIRENTIKGAGVFCHSNADPQVTNNVFMADGGAATGIDWRSGYALGCLKWNTIVGYGTGIFLSGIDTPPIVGNTLVSNGIGIFTDYAAPVILNNIVAGSSLEGILVRRIAGGTPTIGCNDAWDNQGGDYGGEISDQTGLNGNFSGCPSFCHAELGDFRLCDESPCLAGKHPDGYDCGLIGALGQGCSCGPTGPEATNWGQIKAMFGD